MAFLVQNSDEPIIWRGPMKMGALRQFLAEVRWGVLGLPDHRSSTRHRGRTAHYHATPP